MAPATTMLSGPSLARTTSVDRELLANKLRASSGPKSGVAADPSQDQTSAQPQSQAQPQPPVPIYDPPGPIADLHNIEFVPLKKRIISPQHLERFEGSSAFGEILGFVQYCNESVVGKTLTQTPIDESEPIKAILDILSHVSDLVKQTPPDTSSSSRFGNPAFRALYAKISDQSRELHKLIPGLERIEGKGKEKSQGESHDAIEEIQRYFVECWGNQKRIDYGSGMELNFVCWLLCLVKLNILDLSRDAPALVLRVFWRYVQVMRDIQSTYWLEPAGSHGVWGLDDYHFLPFLWGSAQLRDHKHLRPKAIHDAEILEEFSKDYMYFSCIHFINSIKTASLRWHSPMLDDISGVRTWAKVNEGMIKMYRAEVLLKLPIAQHIFFGSLLGFPRAVDGEAEDECEEDGEMHEDEHGHVHAKPKEGQAAGWGDCCGIPIPSAFAAAKEEKEKGVGGVGVRRIPFD